MMAFLLGQFGGWLVAGAAMIGTALGALVMARRGGQQKQQLDDMKQTKKEAQDASKSTAAVDGLSADAVQRELHSYDRK